jgi:thioredoxin-like negative regulator of GroEL
VAIAALIVSVLGLLVGLRNLSYDDTDRVQYRAEALASDGNWAAALEVWRPLNASTRASGRSYLGEGKACLGLGRAAQAEQALLKAIAARPNEPEACLLLLEIYRVEDRPLDAFALGWQALEQVPLEARPELLRELTLTALADLPDELARTTLERWLKADPDDVDARVAYLRRVGTEPRAGDPDRESRLAELTALLQKHTEHLGVREALVTVLADSGEPEQGRQLLESWPVDRQDGRFWRLKGRWALEHDRQPAQAVAAFQSALADFPQDWRTHYRLARAFQNSGRLDEARREATAVSRIRELLDPQVLAPRLDAAFAHLDEPGAFKTLSDLCARAGLARLSEAWRSVGFQLAEESSSAQRLGRFSPGLAPGRLAVLRREVAATRGLSADNILCEKETLAAAWRIRTSPRSLERRT